MITLPNYQMRVLCTGQDGFVGKHTARELQARNHIVLDDLDKKPDAVIHLAWHGIPNYGNPIHFGNIEWQAQFLKKVAAKGITNITITGTCLETLDKFIPYSISKLAVKALAQDLFPELKWVRLWYLYGEGQRQDCLLPRLLRAKDGDNFSVIDGERDFMEITEAASHICDIAEQSKIIGTIDCCSGVAEPVEDFCRRHAPNLVYTKDHPRPPYEPFSFCGDPTKLNVI